MRPQIASVKRWLTFRGLVHTQVQDSGYEFDFDPVQNIHLRNRKGWNARRLKLCYSPNWTYPPNNPLFTYVFPEAQLATVPGGRHSAASQIMNSTLWDETAGSISIIKSGDATSFEQWLWLPDKSDLPSKWCFPIGVYRGRSRKVGTAAKNGLNSPWLQKQMCSSTQAAWSLLAASLASFAVWRLFSFEGITHDGSNM